MSIGLGAGDVATLYTIGCRIGNWLTAVPGDEDFLAMLEEDEASILTRRGLIDMIALKKKWGRSLRLFENGVPQRWEGQAAERLLDLSSRFTAIMMCIVAAVDEFAAASTAREVIKIFLKRLIPTTEINEDTIVSQIGTRINSWRSAAAVTRILVLSVVELTALKGKRNEHSLSRNPRQSSQTRFGRCRLHAEERGERGSKFSVLGCSWGHGSPLHVVI